MQVLDLSRNLVDNSTEQDDFRTMDEIMHDPENLFFCLFVLQCSPET